MLYDKRWERPTRPARLFSRKRFIAWLEQQPPDAAYLYEPCDICAIGRYLKANGTSYLDEIGNHEIEIAKWNEEITSPFPRTFGAAVARAKRKTAKRARELA